MADLGALTVAELVERYAAAAALLSRAATAWLGIGVARPARKSRPGCTWVVFSPRNGVRTLGRRACAGGPRSPLEPAGHHRATRSTANAERGSHRCRSRVCGQTCVRPDRGCRCRATPQVSSPDCSSRTRAFGRDCVVRVASCDQREAAGGSVLRAGAPHQRNHWMRQRGTAHQWREHALARRNRQSRANNATRSPVRRQRAPGRLDRRGPCPRWGVRIRGQRA
jgi:hypothetical protein